MFLMQFHRLKICMWETLSFNLQPVLIFPIRTNSYLSCSCREDPSTRGEKKPSIAMSHWYTTYFKQETHHKIHNSGTNHIHLPPLFHSAAPPAGQPNKRRNHALAPTKLRESTRQPVPRAAIRHEDLTGRPATCRSCLVLAIDSHNEACVLRALGATPGIWQGSLFDLYGHLALPLGHVPRAFVSSLALYYKPPCSISPHIWNRNRERRRLLFESLQREIRRESCDSASPASIQFHGESCIELRELPSAKVS